MGLSVEFCRLACTYGCADRGLMLSNSGEKFAVGNAFVSGDWRSSRWCTAEVSWHRLGCRSVMSVREKCDEKSWEECSGSWECGIPAFAKCPRSGPRLASKERTRTWGTGSHFSKSARSGAPQLFRSLLKDKPTLYFLVKVAHLPAIYLDRGQSVREIK
jgi:hypothetical protein